MTDPTVPDASAMRGWRKSSYSNTESGSCVEVLDNHPSGIPVRDSKTPQGPALLFAAGPWSSFITSLRDGDLPTT